MPLNSDVRLARPSWVLGYEMFSACKAALVDLEQLHCWDVGEPATSVSIEAMSGETRAPSGLRVSL